MTSKSDVLILRPYGQSRLFAAAVTKAGFKPHIYPLSKIRPLDVNWSDFSKDSYDCLIFSSRNGLQVMAQTIDVTPYLGLIVFTVGENTADYARELGFTKVIQGSGGVKELKALIKKNAKEGARLLYVSASYVASEIELDGLSIERLAVYETLYKQILDRDVIKAIKKGEISIITFFSSAMAEQFVTLLSQYNLDKKVNDIDAVCISKNVASKVSTLEWSSVRIASTPTRKDMVSALK
jgi:uroporphyrinogen-III synthase